MLEECWALYRRYDDRMLANSRLQWDDHGYEAIEKSGGHNLK